MKRILSITSIFLMLLAFRVEAATEISKDGYAEAIKTGFSLVEFYSPKCPHCKKMVPLVQKLEEQESYLKVYKINVDLEKTNEGGPSEFMQSKNITSWPTFILYKNGQEIHRFKGSMEYEKFYRLSTLKDRPDQNTMIDLRVEELGKEYEGLIKRGQEMSEELRRIDQRIQQIPSAIDELRKMKTEKNDPDCPSGHCGG